MGGSKDKSGCSAGAGVSCESVFMSGRNAYVRGKLIPPIVVVIRAAAAGRLTGGLNDEGFALVCRDIAGSIVAVVSLMGANPGGIQQELDDGYIAFLCSNVEGCVISLITSINGGRLRLKQDLHAFVVPLADSGVQGVAFIKFVVINLF